MSKTKILIACVSVLFLQSAIAQTLAEKKIYERQEQLLKTSIERLNNDCKTDIKVSFDWPTFSKEDLEKNGAHSQCSSATGGIRQVCVNSADGLKAVQGNIKAISCVQSAAKSMELKDGTFTLGIQYGNSYADRDVQEYIENNL